MNRPIEEFRRILGHYPTGVCAVTAVCHGGRPVGMTVGSFTSVSLEPMLVAFFPDKRSATWPSIEKAGAFCVNVLGDGQHTVCSALAQKGRDRFANIQYRLSGLGSPIIEGALAWIDCKLFNVYEAGDHYIALGQVSSLDLQTQGNPLIFHKGAFARILES